MTNVYTSPFAERYSSREMLYNFSPDKRYRTWRRLWIALAEEERRLGLPITEEQIRELREHAEDIDYAAVRRYEEKLRHDVMAHIRAWGDQCPKARGIVHLGATSMYVVDNTDLILIRDAYAILEREIVNVVAALAEFAERHADVPTVAFTHFQPAQFTTVGKRACLWIYDLLLDLDELAERRRSLRFLGVKGTTGTQASFLALFDGDEAKVRALDEAVTRAMGFERSYTATGQTYSRKVDAQAHAALAGIAMSAHKFANDLRLLQHLGEVQEPFESEQVGSSAMAYKRNPMRSERMTSLARLVVALYENAAFTAASQWFERTLDDSAGKRIALPEAFLAADAVLQLYLDLAPRLVVDRAAIAAHVERELPAIATENILMEAVKAGGDRQELHERIRRHTLEGKGKDLLDRLKKDEAFRAVRDRLPDLLRPEQYVGRAPSQVREFLAEEVRPRLAARREMLGLRSEVRV
ncbi:MAG TPA: adenylosuccinate lyase [Planctomycetota bacterium]|nr:adenylosuccinate lyase [Planctomycetota bacterium]